MKKIEVKINFFDYIKIGNEISFEAWCSNELRNAGIPIKRNSTSQGLESGILTRINNKDLGHITFIWNET